MQMNTKFNIEEFLSLKGYDNETRKTRRKGNGGTQEFFTPFSLVKKICDMVSEDDWKDPEKTFLEPSFGNGAFVCYIIYNRIQHGVSWKDALSHTWGVELLESNVKETHERVIKLLHNMNIKFDESKAMKIMDHNLVCSNFFDWDFDNWCPIKEQEPKRKPKSKELF